ncbi:sortase domain-containing protein [Streptomyces candidus]|uniref:sortase domain-containing protein n=1 Tax=Streptomyces candidus TaxID=67283 RepID=UPI0027E43EC9|nr:sortase [Streptomyces candidus]
MGDEAGAADRRRTTRAGWDTAGTTPGALGTVVIAGHVDTHAGPAVFYPLGSLEKGTTITVVREDGIIAEFTVDAVEEYPKNDFPSTANDAAPNYASSPAAARTPRQTATPAMSSSTHLTHGA